MNLPRIGGGSLPTFSGVCSSMSSDLVPGIPPLSRVHPWNPLCLSPRPYQQVGHISRHFLCSVRSHYTLSWDIIVFWLRPLIRFLLLWYPGAPPFPAPRRASFSKDLQLLPGWGPGARAAHNSARTRRVPSKPLGPRRAARQPALQFAVRLAGTGALECWQAIGQDDRVDTSPGPSGQGNAVRAGVAPPQGRVPSGQGSG